uniref:Uncharacterized protein n=1 Tax=Physcomitrium patens TaxID=3218 RepID=A0A2K1L351_PHYPA|nr:hypothetical protein PHYPA_003250 [Physcomitrium patens]
MELDIIDGGLEWTARRYIWEEGIQDKDEMDNLEAQHSATIMQLRSNSELEAITIEN